MSSKHIVFIFLAFFFFHEVQAQKKELKWSIGGGVGMLNYYGDLSHRFINAKESRLGYNVFLERSISTSLSLRVAYLNGTLEGSDRAEQLIFRNNPVNNSTYLRALNFKTDFHDLNLYLIYNFDNGKIQSKQARVSPYFFAGFGVGKFSPSADLYNADGQRYYYWSDRTIRDIDQNDPMSASAQIMELDGVYETNLADLNLESNYSLFKFQVPVGLGLKFKFNEIVRFQLETQFIYTFTDYLDDVSGGSLSDPDDAAKSYAYNPSGLYPDKRGNLKNKLHDSYLYTSGSLVFSFGKKRSKFDGLVIDPIELQDFKATADSNTFNEKDSVEVKNTNEVAYQKSIEAEIAKIEKELAEIKLKKEETKALENIESTNPPAKVYNIENHGGTIYIGDNMVVNHGVSPNNKELIDEIEQELIDTSIIVATDSLKSVLDGVTEMVDSIYATSLKQDSVTKVDTTIIATEPLKNTLDSITVMVDSIDATSLKQDTVTKVDTTAIIATEPLKITLDSITVMVDSIDATSLHQDTVAKADTSTMIATESLRNSLDSITVIVDSIDATSLHQDTVTKIDTSLMIATEPLKSILDSITMMTDSLDLPDDTLKINETKTVLKDTAIATKKEIVETEDIVTNAKQVNPIDSSVYQANKNISALKSQIEQQRLLDSIQNYQIQQRILAIENLKNKNNQNDSLINEINKLNAISQSNQAAVLDSIKMLKGIIASYDNSLPKDVFAINDSLIVNNTSKITISKLSDLDSVIIASDSLSNDSSLMTNERYINYLRLDYTLQINTLKLELEEQLAKLNKEIAASKSDSINVASTKVSSISQPIQLDTTDRNKEIMAKLDKLEILLSQVNDSAQVTPIISAQNDQDYKKAIDSLKLAMDLKYDLLLEEIKKNKIPVVDSIPKAKVDVSLKDTSVITEALTGLRDPVDSLMTDSLLVDSLVVDALLKDDSLKNDNLDFIASEEIQALNDEITILKEKIAQVNKKNKQEQDSLYQKVVEAFNIKMDEVIKANEAKTTVKEVKVIEMPKPEVIETPKKIVYPATLRVFFKVNQFTVEAQYFSGLQNISDFLNSNSDATILIKGFADSSGNTDYNLKLSKKRADNVRDLLIRNFNVNPNSIRVMGLGEVDEGNNPEFSRRVEVTVQ